MVWNQNYYVYIMTNKNKTVLYIGVTNNLQRRVYEHESGLNQGFSNKYNCHYLIYYEHFLSIEDAIEREKELKKWRREKKEKLIAKQNPEWRFLNDMIKENF